MRPTSRTLAAVAMFLLVAPRVQAQHLWWDLEGQTDATCLYGTVTVLSTHYAIYYCGANWHPGGAAGGYCGIQHNSATERRTIFSIWDTAPGLQPKTTEADPETVFGRFGGEGEGGHTHMLWPWQVGETFEFFVHKQPSADGEFTDARYYIFDRAAGRWRHSATIHSPNGSYPEVSTIGGGVNSFLENFAGTDKEMPKVALYRLWLGPSVSEMKPLTRAGGDGIWGELHDAYFLAEGSQDKLDAVFRELEGMYGKPVFGREGMALPPISAKELSAELVSALENLPRAEIVQDRSDVPRVGRTYLIRSAYSRKCLGVQDAPGLEGASVVQRAASESRIHWKLTKTGNAFRLVNTANGLVLDAAGSGPVMQRQPSRSATQVWSFIKSGDLYHIRCRESGRVLDVADNSTDDGATITTWSLNQPASANQLWIFTEVGEANARLQSRRTNQN